MPANLYNNGITINTVFHTNTTSQSVIWSNSSRQPIDSLIGITFSLGCNTCAGNTPSLFAESAKSKLGLQAGTSLPKNMTNIITIIVKEFNPQKTISPELCSLYINAQNVGTMSVINAIIGNNLKRNLVW